MNQPERKNVEGNSGLDRQRVAGSWIGGKQKERKHCVIDVYEGGIFCA